MRGGIFNNHFIAKCAAACKNFENLLTFVEDVDNDQVGRFVRDSVHPTVNHLTHVRYYKRFHAKCMILNDTTFAKN